MRLDPAALAARQELNPYNADDAAYIAAHPCDFSPATVEIAREVDERAWSRLGQTLASAAQASADFDRALGESRR